MKLRGIVHGIQREMRQVNIMKYESLSKIYYVSPDNYMKDILQGLCFHIRCTLVSESGSITESMILRRFFIIRMRLRFFWKKFTNLMKSFLLLKSGASGCIASIFPSEYLGRSKSTNDIEGVRSTRKEIREIIDGVQPRSGRLESIVNKYISLMTDTKIDFNTCQDIRNFFDDFAHKEIFERKSQIVN